MGRKGLEVGWAGKLGVRVWRGWMGLQGRSYVSFSSAARVLIRWSL